MLRLENVSAGYGGSTVLRDVSLNVAEGEIVALLGPNGAGKTTLLRTATGLLRPRSGRIEFLGQDFTGRPPHIYARSGICHLPEGRGIFPSLTVEENLVIQARDVDKRTAIAEATKIFPALRGRLRQIAGRLSGGEQQMLALTRAYLATPKLVVVDEASLGLAPIIVDQIYEALTKLSDRGIALIIVEQYVQKALALASAVYILDRGSITAVQDAARLSTDEIYQAYIGI